MAKKQKREKEDKGMKENKKTLYSVEKDDFYEPPIEWTVEKETEKTYTIHKAEYDELKRAFRGRVYPITVRKAKMSIYGYVFTETYEEALEKQIEFIKEEIKRRREKIEMEENDEWQKNRNGGGE